MSKGSWEEPWGRPPPEIAEPPSRLAPVSRRRDPRPHIIEARYLGGIWRRIMGGEWRTHGRYAKRAGAEQAFAKLVRVETRFRTETVEYRLKLAPTPCEKCG